MSVWGNGEGARRGGERHQHLIQAWLQGKERRNKGLLEASWTVLQFKEASARCSGAWAPDTYQRSPESARNRTTLESRLCCTATAGHGKHGFCENALIDFRAGNLESSVDHILAGGLWGTLSRLPEVAVVKLLSRVWPLWPPWIVACQAPLSMAPTAGNITNILLFSISDLYQDLNLTST